MALREFLLGDIPAIAAIRNASVEISPDFYSMTVDRYRYDFYDADLPMKSKIMVAEVASRVAGFYHLYTDEHLLQRGRSNLDSVHVHPDMRSRGIGAQLLDSAAATAREWGATYISTAIPESDPRSLAFLERHDFTTVRTFDKMRLSLTKGATAPAVIPTGYSVRNFQPGDETAFVTVFNAVFADHWDFVPVTAAEVAQWNRRPSFDTRGCFLLFEGEALVGFVTVLFNPERAEVTGKVVGRIFEMGVLPTLRRHGLGYVLLQVGLAYAAENGFVAVDLVTDAESDAGKQLYAKVGFEEKRSSLVLHRAI